MRHEPGQTQGQTEGQTPGVVVVTGLSGAGTTTALRALSDAGYYCIDNLPPTLAAATVQTLREAGLGRVALGMDVRTGDFLDSLADSIAALDERADAGLSATQHNTTVLFLDATDAVLVRRFGETRRPHPLLAGEATPAGVIEGVRRERRRLTAIRELATVVLDTSDMTPHDLRRHVLDTFASPSERPQMFTRVLSFGFKHGVPLDADVVFDVRFLDNPNYEPDLRDKTGDDPRVRDFVLRSAGCAELLDHLQRLLVFCLPLYENPPTPRMASKSYLTVAVGCTGGRHRSVAIASELGRRLSEATGRRVGIVHRDAGRGAMIEEVPATEERHSVKGDVEAKTSGTEPPGTKGEQHS